MEQDGQKPTPARLRLQAEERLRELAHAPLAEGDIQRIFHELQVHQIELELQNENLKAAQGEAETALRDLADLNERLEGLVAERTAELVAARNEAEVANRAKSAFLANMGHELLTPLNGMMGMTHLALRRASDPKQVDHLTTGLASAKQLLDLINRVLEFSRLDAASVTLEEKTFSLAQAVAQTLQAHTAAAESKGLHVTSRVDAAVPELLCGDAPRLRQMLGHFLENAVAYSKQGQITVSVGVERADDASVVLRIEVVDQGIGLAPAQAARLFRPFAQADDSAARRHGGAGLGLITARHIARLMGGDVGVVRSDGGDGSTFWITARLRRAAGA